MILKGSSGKNLGKNSDSEKNAPSENQFFVFMQVTLKWTLPDLIDGFITRQSTLPCRANQETPFVDERVFQNRGVFGQVFPFLPSPPPSRTFLRSPQFSRVQEAKNVSNLRRALYYGNACYAG